MSQKKPMTDEERADLVQRLMDDLEDFVAERSIQSRQNQDGAKEDDKSVDEIAEVITIIMLFVFLFAGHHFQSDHSLISCPLVLHTEEGHTHYFCR